MTGIPTPRPRGRRTGTRVAMLAVLLALALGAVVGYLASRPDRHSAAGRGAAAPSPASSATPHTPTTAPAAPSGVPSAPATTSVPATSARSPVPPDSAVDPDAVFLDPAAAAATRGPAPAAAGPPRCGDWRTGMTGEQRTVYSVALLRAAWQNDGSSGTPPGSLVGAYSSAISAACAGKDHANGMVADVARAVYAGDPDKWGP
jgi:hypothetical protein